jgi:biopolymer transport protein ExbD
MALKSRNKVSANFNMSSMTDIVFLLLIFFMLTFGIERHEELDLQLPEGSAKMTEKSETIAIHIEDVVDDSLSIPNFYIDIGSGPISVKFENIDEKIKGVISEDTAAFKGITLYTDKTVAVEHVSNIMLIASQNDCKIALALEEE